MNKFSTGNLETLTSESKESYAKLRQALKEYFKKWYSANIMSLVVVGNYDIDKLEEMVKKNYADI